ncbi:MAG: aminotransferase class V-fold PLP-dependent enzyme [Acutalibacteraceae bacterium]
MIYLDNAATSFPKPFEVIKAVNDSFYYYPANPGRSGHNLSQKTAEQVYKTREALNDFFNGYGSEFVSFFSNCTTALNVGIKGLLRAGDHVIISCLEHNSVARPVYKLKQNGLIDYTVFNVGETVEETLVNFKKSFKSNTALCVITAVSNVFGNILPIKELSRIAHENGALVLVDGAQGAGIIPIDMKNQDIDCLCVPGHKGLLGPMGTGVLLHKNLNFNTILEGGTGTSSFDLAQPQLCPERLESGTLNVPGICGLKKGVEIVENMGVSNIFNKESQIGEEIFYGLKSIPNVILYRENYGKNAFAPVISFNIKGLHSEQVSRILNEHEIYVRGGFHCSPLAHEFYGTKQTGAVRLSPSFNTSKKDINNLLNVVKKIAI